jgi:hypothetical protein
MVDIYVTNEDPKTWQVTVEDEDGSSTDHTVTIDPGYYKRLTGKEITPEELLERSFEFLLENEPKESILGSFDLSLIQKYFPDFEDKIKLR